MPYDPFKIVDSGDIFEDESSKELFYSCGLFDELPLGELYAMSAGDKWTKDEINEYIKIHNVLVLFILPKSQVGEAELSIHGEIDEKEKLLLKIFITKQFGGKNMSEDLVIMINEYASTWYSQYIVPGPIRLLNFAKKKRR